MNETATLPIDTTSTGAIPFTLNLDNILWVEEENKQWCNVLQSNTFGANDNQGTDNQETGIHWRKFIANPPGSAPNEPFPEKDSNNNPCRILAWDPISESSVSSSTHAYVIYPDGHTRILPCKTTYETHYNAKMCHFALAALEAWSAGEAREYPTSWRGYDVGGTVNAATSITPVMWLRATIQGYLQPVDNTCLYSQGKRIRTDKPIEAKVRKTRKLKNSAWPFSEKEHWFSIMNGTLQITHTNMTQILGSGRSASRREQETIKKSFPVFSHKAEFKRARKFFETLSEKKNKDAHRIETGTLESRNWDPLKDMFNNRGNRGLQSTIQSNQTRFSSPYALVTTSMMLGCVPKIEDNGSIQDYQELTPEYITALKDIEPIQKSVTGAWKGGDRWFSITPEYTEKVCDTANIDNLTHMYLILLNEARLLSNEDLVRWTQHNGLYLQKSPFTSTFIHNCKYDVFGYKLTDTLDYTCIVWTPK